MSTALQKTNTKLLNRIGVDEDTYLALKNSIFPGAKDESIALAVSYCKAAKLDIMQKPVHLVQMSVKNAQGKYEYRDVVMPGITLYRIQAARSGLCLGVTEPEFGPETKTKLGGIDVVHPTWCKVTVKKLVNGHIAEFTAYEIWSENVALSKEGKPNMMWQKRPFGQIAKCAESQAWRKAFPELFGGIYTAEEMEGKGVVEPAQIVTHKPTNLTECISEDQVTFLKDKFVETETDEMNVLSHLKISCLEEMNVNQFLQITRQLDKKADKLKKSQELEINRVFEAKEEVKVDDELKEVEAQNDWY